MEDLQRSFDDTNPNEKIVINVGGLRHETYSNTLRSIPDTRLFWISENSTQLAEYDPNTNEYFFDRHPGVFAQVLNFYRTGKLHCPNDVCGPLFEEELAFWGIDELQVEPCCWLNYKKHREAQAHLDPFEGRESDGESVEDMDMTIYGLVGDSIRRRNRTLWKKYQPKIWTLFEEPYSSIPAQIIAFIILFLIITSVAIFCLETVPYFSEPKTTPNNVIYYIEASCVAAFTLEFIVRLIVCPNKLAFLKMPMNWIDFCAILPFYLQLALKKTDMHTMVVFRVIRLIRVFRIFKLSRHSYGLQILGHTLKSSCSELFLLAFFLSIGVIIFSSIIYYAEKDVARSHFKTIPHGFWWAVVTMTTLGYGDMVPLTWQGKIVGSLCAVSGVLMIALPVPVIVSNFSLYYSHAKARMNLPKRKRPLIFGAASALRVAQPFAVTEHKPNVITQLMEEGARDDDDPENPNLSRRTPRSSGRYSPRCRSPKNLHNVGGITPRLSPRASITSIQDTTKNNTLIVPEIHSRASEPQELQNTRRTSMIPKPIPQLVLSGSGELHPPEIAPLPSPLKSPVSLKLSETGSMTSLSDKSDRSSASAKRALQVKSLSADSPSRGRRGRRGSIYIVGFTAKHWQNKALNKKSERKILSADNSTDREYVKSKSFYHSLSCETCDNRKARSAEVLIRSERSEKNIVEPVKPAGPRRDSVTIQHNPPSVTHKSISRTSSGTQTSANRASPSPTPRSRAKSYAGNLSSNAEPVSVQGKTSQVEHSDDSLCVHRHLLSQRRSSSPLRRQHAVFTFDVSEQSPDANTVSASRGHINDNQLAPVKVVHQATSPTLPSVIESISNTWESRDDGNINVTKYEEDENRETPSPPLLDGRGNSVRNGKVRPKSMPVSSYVNASYQKEDDDSTLQSLHPRTTLHDQNRHRNGKEEELKENEMFVGCALIEKRGFQPYRKDAAVCPIPSLICKEHCEQTQDDLDKDQYSTGRRTPLGSVSNASLPSISEEHGDHHGNSSLNVIPHPNHKLHRPHSMPLEVNEGTPHSPPCINRSSSVPLSHVVLSCKAFDEPKTLLQRRQGPDLSLGNSPDQTLQLNQLDVANYPWFRRVLNSSGYLKVSGCDDRQAVSSNQITAALSPSPLLSGELPLSADDRLLYSPHTPPLLSAPNTRDTATSPFITVWDETEELLDRIPLGHQQSYSKSTNRDRSRASPLQFDSIDSERRQNSLDVELQPITRVEDQAGREYELYAIPTGIDGSVFFSRSNSEDTENSKVNIYQTSSETFGLPSEIIRDISTNARNTSERIRDQSVDARSVQKNQTQRRLNELDENAQYDGIDKNFNGTSRKSPNGNGSKLQRSDDNVIFNGHEPLQQKHSGNLLLTKRPTSLPSPDRRKARMFFGDSGISSVGSGSTASTEMSHSLDLDTESKERKEAAANILNPIKETELENGRSKVENFNDRTKVENPSGRSIASRTDSGKTSTVNIKLSSMNSRETVIDILTNSDIYEASLV